MKKNTGINKNCVEVRVNIRKIKEKYGKSERKTKEYMRRDKKIGLERDFLKQIREKKEEVLRVV